MFKRKLTALQFNNPNNFNVNDLGHFKNAVVWLEDRHIRHYKVEDRQNLRNVKSPDWNNHFDKYLDDLECIVDRKDYSTVMDWLLGWAIHLKYEENSKSYNEKTAESVSAPKSLVPKVVTSNPLDKLSFESDDFKMGVKSLAKLLKVTEHPDHLITLKACCNLIKERLSKEVMQNPNEHIIEGRPVPLDEYDLGFETGDYVLNQAAKILRLLFIHDLRHLQTTINEAIVAIQAITANPKTDSSLGKVGI